MASAARKQRPRERRKRERGATIVQSLTAIRLIAKEPRTSSALMKELACSRNSVHRLLHALEEAGFSFKKESSEPKMAGSEVGQFVFYSLQIEALQKKFSPTTKPRWKNGAMSRTARGTGQAITAIRLLTAGPIRPMDLMAELECSRRTVERVLHGLEGFGLELAVEHTGRDAFYTLNRDAVKKEFGF